MVTASELMFGSEPRVWPHPLWQSPAHCEIPTLLLLEGWAVDQPIGLAWVRVRNAERRSHQLRNRVSTRSRAILTRLEA